MALALAAADSAGTGSESKASSRNQRQHDILSKIILNGFSKILLHSGCVGIVRKQQLELGNIKSDLVSGGGHGVGVGHLVHLDIGHNAHLHVGDHVGRHNVISTFCEG